MACDERVVLSSSCFAVQLGFAMLEVGSVRVFHMQNILIKVRQSLGSLFCRVHVRPYAQR